MTTEFGTERVPGPGPGKMNMLAIGSLVSSVLSIFSCCIPDVGPFVGLALAAIGLVLGIIAMGQIKKTRENGYGMALGGAIVGGVVLLLTIILLIAGAVLGVAVLKNLRNMENFENGGVIQQPADPDVLDSDLELGEPVESPNVPDPAPTGETTIDEVTPDASDEAVPEPANP
ncbi:MAG: DUF4190 domain-containing protein [Planctomycetota bacterium]|nr:DUF4190 domain-containing protein [Planctomycetaceae bacterium]MDQ3333457.1 DUF4190 domain-containing protein [Planctomycetota bacterium]